MTDLIYEFRSYRLRPGAGPRYLALLQLHGAAVVSRHLPLLGFWLTETGRLNMLHHLWAYTGLDDRAACRARLMADTDWTEGFIPMGFPLIETQEGRLMRLDTGSPRLAGAVAQRRQGVAPDLATGPVSTGALHCVTFGGDAGEALIGTFTTLSGEATGQRVTLSDHGDGPGLALPPGNPANHELMRPASFSPLR